MLLMPPMAPVVDVRVTSSYVESYVFVVQWGIGLLVDLSMALGLERVAAYQAAFAVYGLSSLLSWLYFLLNKADNEALT